MCQDLNAAIPKLILQINIYHQGVIFFILNRTIGQKLKSSPITQPRG